MSHPLSYDPIGDAFVAQECGCTKAAVFRAAALRNAGHIANPAQAHYIQESMNWANTNDRAEEILAYSENAISAQNQAAIAAARREAEHQQLEAFRQRLSENDHR